MGHGVPIIREEANTTPFGLLKKIVWNNCNMRPRGLLLQAWEGFSYDLVAQTLDNKLEEDELIFYWPRPAIILDF